MTQVLICACALIFGAPGQRISAQMSYLGISADHPTGSEAIDARDLVLAFDMSTRTGNQRLRDFGPLGNHGEISGTTALPAINGHGMLFRVATDRIHLPENGSLAIDGPITIALWFRMDALSIHQHILACDDKFALWVTPQNRLRFSDTLGHGVDSSDPIMKESWYSLVVVYDGEYAGRVTKESVRLYLDGIQLDTDIVNRSGDDPVRWVPGELYSTDACYVGFESHQGNEAHQSLQFEGAIDELLIFGRAFSPNEVRVFASRP